MNKKVSPRRILEDFGYVILWKIFFLMAPKSAFFEFFLGLILFLSDYKSNTALKIIDWCQVNDSPESKWWDCCNEKSVIEISNAKQRRKMLEMEQKAMIHADMTISVSQIRYLNQLTTCWKLSYVVLCNVKIIIFVCVWANCHHRCLQLIASWLSTISLTYLSELNTLLQAWDILYYACYYFLLYFRDIILQSWDIFVANSQWLFHPTSQQLCIYHLCHLVLFRF